MWSMARHSIGLFFRGRLFRDTGKALRQMVLGTLITTILLIAAAAGLSLQGEVSEPVLIASGLAGFIGGLLQPVLFKDLKYM